MGHIISEHVQLKARVEVLVSRLSPEELAELTPLYRTEIAKQAKAFSEKMGTDVPKEIEDYLQRESAS